MLCQSDIILEKSLHGLLKSSSKAKVKVGDRASVNILFIIPIVITFQIHLFEIYTMVSEIHDNIYLVLSVKWVIELEAEISVRKSIFKVMNKAVLFFSYI